MGYTVISAKEFAVRLKCTVHSSGKIGFTEATAAYMELSGDSTIQFAKDDDDESILYLIHGKVPNEDAFKATKSGDYFYVNTKAMFDALGYDYRKYSFIFDMTRLKDSEEEAYKLIQRKTPRKQK